MGQVKKACLRMCEVFSEQLPINMKTIMWCCLEHRNEMQDDNSIKDKRRIWSKYCKVYEILYENREQ